MAAPMPPRFCRVPRLLALLTAPALVLGLTVAGPGAPAAADPPPDYKLRDGDAAFLPPGTVVHAIRGVPTTREVTASRDGRYLYYAAQPSS